MFEALLKKLHPFASVFEKHGKSIYLVGGAVRNLLLGHEQTDYDFTTDARPDEVMTFFKRVIPTGIQHGTVTILFDGHSYEVTTFRVDGTYLDGRRPQTVSFTPSLEEDLKRRDFTINALALDLKTGALLDFHKGKEDLDAGVLRAIGVPGERFDEDALRILRLFRFAAQLNFTIDNETLKAVPSRITKIGLLSRERIKAELGKLQSARFPQSGWRPIFNLDLLPLLFGELSLQPASPDILDVLSNLPNEVRWPFFLHQIDSNHDMIRWEKQLRLLTFSNAEIQSILLFGGILQDFQGVSPGQLQTKKVIDRCRSREVDSLCALISAVGRTFSLKWTPEKAEAWSATLKMTAATNEPIYLSELAVNGNDLITGGFVRGAALGKLLRMLQEWVWEHPEDNRKERLLEKGRDIAPSVSS